MTRFLSFSYWIAPQATVDNELSRLFERLKEIEEHLEEADSIATADGVLRISSSLNRGTSREAGKSGNNHEREPFGFRPTVMSIQTGSNPLAIFGRPPTAKTGSSSVVVDKQG